MSFGCSSKGLGKFQNRIFNTRSVRLKKYKKMIHKRYSKSDPQLLLKDWPTIVTQKVIHKH